MLVLTSFSTLHIVNIFGENIPITRKTCGLFSDELTNWHLETEHVVKCDSFTRHIEYFVS